MSVCCHADAVMRQLLLMSFIPLLSMAINRFLYSAPIAFLYVFLLTPNML
jgi:hypothetical protein